MSASSTEFLSLSQEDVVAAGGTDTAAMIDVMARAFAVKAAGQVFMPPKVMITWSDGPDTEERDGRIIAMPAYVGGEFDVAGLAVRHLAGPGSRVACLIGAGVLAHTQLDALRIAMPQLAEVRVYDPRTERCAGFCASRSAATGLDVRPAASAEEAVRGAAVVVTATMAVDPTFAPDWLDAGATVVLVSSLDGPVELHAVTDLLVVDDWEHESTHEGRYAQRLVAAGSSTRPAPASPSCATSSRLAIRAVRRPATGWS